MTTAARRAEKRAASQAHYEMEARRQAADEVEADDQMLNAVRNQDYTDAFNDEQCRALARMFRTILPRK